ncbi:hypothetical protein [Streptomyces syringium]|uniref:hypothetical protein n=1 Tax=Streptomyces syringium TaxID=76729 RepID=UPI0033E7836F
MDPRIMPMWQELAQRDDLPMAALPTVIQALARPVSPRKDVAGRGERRRLEAFADSLPHLMPRTMVSPGLRARLIHASSPDQIVTMAATGTVTVNDLAAITARRRVWPELITALAAHPHQVEQATELLDHLSAEDLENVLARWGDVHRAVVPAPGIPGPLVEAICHRLAAPLAADLAAPQTALDGIRRIANGNGDRPADCEDILWRILDAHPRQWPSLAADPCFGHVVCHMLLEHAPAPRLNDTLLNLCLPVATCPELTNTSQPVLTARERLRRLGHRARQHPGLLTLIPDRLHAAAADSVSRGKPLHYPQQNDGVPGILRIVEDIATVGANPQQLALATELLAKLPGPLLVTGLPRLAPTAWHAPYDDEPHRLLERHYQHCRAQTLVRIASNPSTPSSAVTTALTSLHPAELAWIRLCPDTPLWCARAAAALPAPPDLGIVRILTDTELDALPDPASTLQSWLDARLRTDAWVYDDICSAVLRSRHRTPAILRQLSARHVLIQGPPPLAAQLLLKACGSDPSRWSTLFELLESPLEDETTFGQLTDQISHADSKPERDCGTSTPAEGLSGRY